MIKNIIKSTRAVLDIENGGFSQNAGIVEIALLVIDENYQPLEKYSAIIQPYFIEGTEELMSYSRKAAEIHGITIEDQEREGVPPRESVKEIEDILQTYNVQEFIGHNIKKFDAPRMAQFFDRFSTYKKENPFEAKELTCTMEMAKNYISLGSYSLASCCNYFEICNEDAHRALSDVMATAQLLQYLEE